MTFAEQFRKSRRLDYANTEEFLDLVLSIDSKAKAVLIEGRVVLEFSDGSTEHLRKDT